MVIKNFQIKDLELVRRQLGMTVTAVASRSRISRPTVARVLSGRHPAPSFASVMSIAKAMGVRLDAAVDIAQVRQEQATKKAEQLVGMVQGTSLLEGQAVDTETRRRMVKQTVHELLAGSARVLWSD